MTTFQLSRKTYGTLVGGLMIYFNPMINVDSLQLLRPSIYQPLMHSGRFQP